MLKTVKIIVDKWIREWYPNQVASDRNEHEEAKGYKIRHLNY